LELKARRPQNADHGYETQVRGLPIFESNDLPLANPATLCKLELCHLPGFPGGPDMFCHFNNIDHDVQYFAHFFR
jgi:hypothetical protein